MAPIYKPLTSAGGITGAPGLPAEVFAPPGRMTFDDAQKAEAILRAQQLANQSNEIKVGSQQAIHDALTQQYGPDAQQSQQEFNPQEALQTAQRLALQSGDIDTAINIERSRSSFQNSSNRQLSPEEVQSLQAQGLDVIEGETLAGARLKMALKNSMNSMARADAVQGRFDELAPIRQLDGTLKYQKATGTEFQKVSDTALSQLENADGALQSIGAVGGLLSQLDPGALSALRAGQITDIYKDPGSPAYRMYARLELLKKQVARMNDSGALTELDVSMFQPLTVGSPIYDDANSVAQRMNDLAGYIAAKQQSVIKRNEQGYRNMDRFKDPNYNTSGQSGSFMIPNVNAQGDQAPGSQVPGAGASPPLANYGAPIRTAEENAYKEQYKARIRQQRGM